MIRAFLVSVDGVAFPLGALPTASVRTLEVHFRRAPRVVYFDREPTSLFTEDCIPRFHQRDRDVLPKDAIARVFALIGGPAGREVARVVVQRVEGQPPAFDADGSDALRHMTAQGGHGPSVLTTGWEPTPADRRFLKSLRIDAR